MAKFTPTTPKTQTQDLPSPTSLAKPKPDEALTGAARSARLAANWWRDRFAEGMREWTSTSSIKEHCRKLRLEKFLEAVEAYILQTCASGASATISWSKMLNEEDAMRDILGESNDMIKHAARHHEWTPEEINALMTRNLRATMFIQDLGESKIFTKIDPKDGIGQGFVPLNLA